MILDPENLPPEPDPSVNDSTVAGVDSNNNGIRDDIERWIAASWPNSAKMRAAVAQMALNSQKELTTPNLSKEEAYQLGKESMDAVQCCRASSKTSNEEWDIKDFLARMYNTQPRVLALHDYQDILGSRVFKVPSESACNIPLEVLKSKGDL